MSTSGPDGAVRRQPKKSYTFYFVLAIILVIVGVGWVAFGPKGEAGTPIQAAEQTP
jgi:hypothetical protein